VGGSGNDTLTGNSLANILVGNAGGDTLNGGSGDDSLFGGTGDDTYVFGTATSTAEADTVAEAANRGTDTLSFSSLTTDVILSLETTAVQTVDANRTLKLNAGSVFENLMGGSGNDTLTGNSLANILVGNAGGDTLNGGSGDDSLFGGTGDDTYVFGTVTSTAEADTVAEAANRGTDTLSFSSLTTDVIVSLETTAVQTVDANRTLKLNAASVFENIAGGSGNDTLTGNSLANILVGNAGDDTLNGSGGRDILIGGLGLDTLNGGEDEDILIAGFTTSDSLFSNLNVLLAEWVSVNAYDTRITNLRAGVGAPAVSLKAKVNVLNDAGEDDSLVGGNGTDWYFRALDDVVTGLVIGEVLDIL
jgi:Ca2+-binding RTX toxin-like protein